MRFLIAALAGLALAVVPALAADHSVTAADFRFDPPDITVVAGDTVTWTQREGSHTVHFEGEAAGHPLSSPYRRTFDTPGTYAYVCDPHAPDMAGRVVVKAPETTGTTTTATTTTTTTEPAPTQTTTTPTATPGPISAPVVTPAVTVRRLGAVFTRRSGVRLRITSDRARTLTGTLRRHNRSYGKLRLAVRRGTRVHRIRRTRSGRRLARGGYELTLRAASVYGLPVTVRFRVR